jgi:hypothetical protein
MDRSGTWRCGLTLLVEHDDVAAGEINGMSGTEASQAATDNNDSRSHLGPSQGMGRRCRMLDLR